MLPKRLSLAVCPLVLLAAAYSAPAQTIKALTHKPPVGVGLAFLMTDGTVLCQSNGLSAWYKLTPDITGSYLNGTWTKAASLPAGYVPDAFASAVLADGRLIIEGGEYNKGAFALTDMGAIYDPLKNTWTAVVPPAGWGYIGDSPSVVLPSGLYLLGRKLDMRMATLDPKNLQWTEVASAGKADFNAEEGWTLMPNGTVLTYDVKDAPNSERYVPSMQMWLQEGSTQVDLHSPPTVGGIKYGPGLIYHPPGEVGPGILRPDGTVFASGAANTGSGHTAVYHPGATITDPGSWTAGPNFPNDAAGDSNAILLPNGNVLVEGNSGRLYEFNGTKLTAGPSAAVASMLMLPTGQALLTGGAPKVYIPAGTYQPAWAPKIANSPATVVRGSTYQISGTQFNGLSQAAGFGDEYQTATNYPLVRITNNATKHVFYARTHDHSTMGVATGSATVSTNFDVPAKTETGASTIEVVANGIPSPAVAVTVN